MCQDMHMSGTNNDLRLEDQADQMPAPAAVDDNDLCLDMHPQQRWHKDDEMNFENMS